MPEPARQTGRKLSSQYKAELAERILNGLETLQEASKRERVSEKTLKRWVTRAKKRRAFEAGGGLVLSAQEKASIQVDISKARPEDEKRIRDEFAEKYGRVGKTLLSSRYKAVRDLSLNVACLYEMLVDPDYVVSWQVKKKIILALGYFLSPADAIPDAVPLVGYLDDAMVVMHVVHLIQGDIAKYREFRRKAGRPLPNA